METLSYYEITLKVEVLREKSAGIMADFMRFKKKNHIQDDAKDAINFLDDAVTEIYRNIFNPEYDNLIALKEANARLDLAADVLKKLEG